MQDVPKGSTKTVSRREGKKEVIHVPKRKKHHRSRRQKNAYGDGGAPPCPCLSPVPCELVGAEDIYNWSPEALKEFKLKKFWRCNACGRYVGCHPGTTQALGYPADAETRKARSAAHVAFDVLWKHHLMTRAGAYKWLRERMGVNHDVHIGQLNETDALRVAQIARDFVGGGTAQERFLRANRLSKVNRVSSFKAP